MPKESEDMLKWRKRQPEGRIMGSETFKRIEAAAAAKHGKKKAKKVAGAAYWQAAESKFEHRKK